MKAIGILLLLPCLATAAERRYSAMTEDERNAVADEARHTPALAERILKVSAPFRGTPYGISPLGEGSGIDPDPLLRWDLVDCLTFVETSIALAVSPSNDRLLTVLYDIRYSRQPPEFTRRNHFVEAQWAPNNIAKGYLRPISRDIAGDDTMVVTMEMTPKRWKSRPDKTDLPLPDGAVPMGEFSLDVVPIAFAASHLAEIPNGSLLFVVRQDVQRIPTRVSHVGFVLEQDGKKVLRHASKEPYERVVDEPLAAFIERNSKYDGRPVVGFSLYEVRVPAERIGSLK